MEVFSHSMNQKNILTKQKGFAHIFILIIVLLIVGGLGYWLYGGRPQNMNTQNLVENDFSDAGKTISSITNSFNKTSMNKFAETKGNVWWTTEDNWNIRDMDTPSTVLKIVPENIDNSGIKNIKAKQINKDVEKIFLENGFTKDKVNSSKSEEDSNFYDYVLAFTKDNLKCTITTSPDVGWTGNEDYKKIPGHFDVSVSCSDKIEEKYKEQLPYLQGLNEHNNAISTISRSGDFANLNINARRTGYYVIGKFINNKFTKIGAGQDYQQCSLIDKYNVPKEIYTNCYNGMEPRFKD